ncbi:S9 family peptidase [Sphingomonas sp. G124]|uniref:S9 family peptidase n=1 Tax=Sphingomonas cremea TaxID=2904799 RepID=A0A9X1TWY5_9SPHN|nr:S9 family peptidase [Sphingomonas cremea]MCF2515919.1 S9 family peptidase [Sphingomonas cremea]
MRLRTAMLFAATLASPALAESANNRFGPDDLARLADVTEPEASPDGRWLAYTVTTTNVDADEKQSDLWRVNWDGKERKPLTQTPDTNETHPQWSPDRKSIAFLSDRVGDDAKTQVWIMGISGGAPSQVTDFPEGVEDFVWAPDGQRLAIIAWDPERPKGAKKPKNPPPIVTDRYQFKEDFTGYLTSRRKHLYLFDLASKKAELLTPGNHDEQLPSWSPDGRQIAYVTKRGSDPDRTLNYDIYLIASEAGAKERQLTRFPGSDLDPYWESRPTWSPDGKTIAYLKSGEDKWIYYAPWQLALVDVASGKESLPAPIDRNFYKPRWSPDGRYVLALVEQNRVTQLSRINIKDGTVSPLTQGRRFDIDFSVAADGRIAVLGGDALHPPELSAIGPDGPRALTDHNDWLKTKRLAPIEHIEFNSADGTRIEGFLVKPIDYKPGRRYPTILRIHGGPVYQFSDEFMPDWQAYAARGFAIVAANPRGSSGRGFDFARAIYADWGNKDVEDVLAAVDHVVQLGVADPARLGIGGRSYGSILTNYVIARDQRFKAAVSGAGSANMLGMYGYDQYTREYELELGTPWANREAYDRASYPFLHADLISTPTLFYCEEKDFNVPCLGTEQMYQALRSRGIPTRLVIYPGENHPLTVPSYLHDRMQRLLGWYDRFLKPGEPQAGTIAETTP